MPFQLDWPKRASERFREIAVIKTKDDLLKQVGTALGSPRQAIRLRTCKHTLVEANLDNRGLNPGLLSFGQRRVATNAVPAGYTGA